MIVLGVLGVLAACDDGHGTPSQDEPADGDVAEPAICGPRDAANPAGLDPIKYLDAADTVYPTAKWRIAITPETEVGWVTFADAAETESAILLDRPEQELELAGFLVSRSPTHDSALAELDAVLAAIGKIATISPRASGANIRSLDGFDTVVSTRIEIKTRSITTVPELRAELLPILLGRPAQAVTMPDWGSSDRDFMLVLQTLYRADTGQTFFVGSVSRRFDYDRRDRATVLHAEDLANGSGLALAFDGEGRGCEEGQLDRRAEADILWVLDQSESMDHLRQQIVDNAVAFFGKAIAVGLDFRMGITDMDDASQGVFASRAPDGRGERWLGPDDLEAFTAAVTDPSGPADGDGGAEDGLTQLEAVLERHLPRGEDPFFVRPGAQLAVIIATDEVANEVADAHITHGWDKGPLDPGTLAALDQFVAPYRDLVEREDVLVNLIAEPMPLGDSACSDAPAGDPYGYLELVGPTGGQWASVCQPDLGPTLDVMVDSIVGRASPIVLESVPISATISVTRDGEPVPRSRSHGWDYRADANAIVFYGMPPIDPGHPEPYAIAYRRWQERAVE
jgi:hypothetical protein